MGDDMILVLSHVVKAPFDQILHDLHAWLIIGPTAGYYPKDISLYSNLKPQLVPQEFRKCLVVSTELLAFNFYHQPHTHTCILALVLRQHHVTTLVSEVAFEVFPSQTPRCVQRIRWQLTCCPNVLLHKALDLDSGLVD